MPQLIPEQWALGTCSVRAERLSSHLRWGAAKPTGASVQTLRRARLVPVLFQQGWGWQGRAEQPVWWLFQTVSLDKPNRKYHPLVRDHSSDPIASEPHILSVPPDGNCACWSRNSWHVCSLWEHVGPGRWRWEEITGLRQSPSPAEVKHWGKALFKSFLGGIWMSLVTSWQEELHETLVNHLFSTLQFTKVFHWCFPT